MINNKVVLVLLVLLAMWNLGMALYEDKKKIAVFVAFAAAIYLMNAFLGGQSEVNGFWADEIDGLTWLSHVVMPMVLSQCLSLMKGVSAGKVTHKVRRIVEAAVLLLAGQFLNEKGGFYIALMWLLTVAVILVRKGYDYVITSGRFKKRI